MIGEALLVEFDSPVVGKAVDESFTANGVKLDSAEYIDEKSINSRRKLRKLQKWRRGL